MAINICEALVIIPTWNKNYIFEPTLQVGLAVWATEI